MFIGIFYKMSYDRNKFLAIIKRRILIVVYDDICKKMI